MERYKVRNTIRDPHVSTTSVTTKEVPKVEYRTKNISLDVLLIHK